MTENTYFEGLTCLYARGNAADLADLVDHLATKYLIVSELRVTELARNITIAPPTPQNREAMRRKALAATCRKRSE